MTMLGRDVGADEVGRLDTFPVHESLTIIEFTGHELQALCPAVEGIQPDIYKWRISLHSPKRSIESKSLKLYLTKHRDSRIFAEDLAALLCQDVWDSLDGDATVVVELRQNTRGGIVESVTAVRTQRNPT